MLEQFHILIIEPVGVFSRALALDIQFEKIHHTGLERVTTFEEAHAAIQRQTPQVVILSLHLPNDGTKRFLELHPPLSRSFALIFFDYRLKQQGLSPTTPREQVAVAHIVAEQQASGYLYVGAFNNADVVRSLERARRQVENLLIQEQQRGISSSLEEYLRHPLVLAVAKHIQNRNDGTPIHNSVAESSLRFILSNEEYTVSFDRILRVEGDGKYCKLFYFATDGTLESKHLQKTTIVKGLPESLVRVHTSHWVNIAYIRHIGIQELTLLNSDVVQMSRKGRNLLNEIFSIASPQVHAISLLHDALLHPSANIFQKEQSAPPAARTRKRAKVA